MNGRADRLVTLAWCYTFNVVMLMVVGHNYLASVPDGTTLTGWMVTLLAFTANFAMLALVPAILVLPTLLTRRAWVMRVAAVVLFGLLNFFIYADAVIYQLWRFHFNGMVWNLLTTSGAGDTVTAGKGTVASAIAVAVLIYAGEIALAVWLVPRVVRIGVVRRLRPRRALACWCGAVAGLIVLDKAVYDVGDLRGDAEVVRLHNILPLYQTVTIQRFASRVLGIKSASGTEFAVRKSSAALRYPKSPLRFRPDGARPNVLIVAIEGARFDMLRPDVMPNLTRWGERHLVFANNYSAGNTTRYGIFGLIYGLYGSYWQQAVAERQSPVLMRALKNLGYNFRIVTSTDLNYPEFRSTCFVDVPDAITDHWSCDRVQRDAAMTDEFIKFLDERRRPFFAFMFYDSSHQPYRYPPAHGVFDVAGSGPEINYVKLAREGGRAAMAPLKNRYQNSLHYVDAELARTLQALEERGLLDNTFVFICGDHGEEFGEFGLFGHDSEFHRYQTQTLMVAHIPGSPPQKLNRLTSHLDVPATILTAMGVENPLADYTQGLPLLGTQEHAYAFITSWDNAAIVDSNSITWFGLVAYKASMDVLTPDNVPLPNQREAFAARRAELLDAWNGMSQFTK